MVHQYTPICDNGTSLILLLETAADKTMMWIEILHRANLT